MNDEQLRPQARGAVQPGLHGQRRRGRKTGLVTHGSAVGAVLVLAALAVAGPAMASATMLASHAQAGVSARATFDSPLITDTQRHEALTASDDYVVDASAYSTTSALDREALLRMRIEVNGIGPDLGQVMFRADYGGRNMVDGTLAPLVNSGWFYSFSVDEDSELTLRYDVGVDGQGVSGSLSIFAVQVTGMSLTNLTIGRPGTLTYHLDAGRTYSFDIQTSLPVLRNVWDDPHGSYYGFVEWSIEPSAAPPAATLPEPASGALAAAALLAAVLRGGRQRTRRPYIRPFQGTSLCSTQRMNRSNR